MRTLPKFIVWIAVISTLLTCIAEPGVAIAEDSIEVFELDSIRADLVMVIDLNFEEDLVSVINSNGQIFTFSDVDDWFVGDYAIVLYNTMGTLLVYDDQIIRIFYERPDLVEDFGSKMIQR